jgi:transposase
MKCPKCKSEKKVKDGIVKGKQRYKCRKCAYRYTVEFKDGTIVFKKRLALILYLNGLGSRRIGRVLAVSNVTVLNWIKAFGIKAGELSYIYLSAEALISPMINEVAIDEMHGYIDSNKTKNGSGSLLISWSEEEYTLYLATEVPMKEHRHSLINKNE